MNEVKHKIKSKYKSIIHDKQDKYAGQYRVKQGKETQSMS